MTSEATAKELISSFVERLSAANPQSQFAVILVGSVARNAATAQSDLDLVVVAEEALDIERVGERLHVQSFTEVGYLERLREGDDFVAWCVRYGIPIVNSVIWDRIVNSTEAQTWPEWRLKIEHAARRLLLANDLLLLGDEDAAAEELTYAVSHVGRSLLLKQHIFPLSRPEMIAQLANAGHAPLSKILQELADDQVSQPTMRQAIRYVKKLLVYLDRDQFKKYLLSRKEAQARRRRRPRAR
jgi:predicted nucleotidyltransferase